MEFMGENDVDTKMLIGDNFVAWTETGSSRTPLTTLKLARLIADTLPAGACQLTDPHRQRRSGGTGSLILSVKVSEGATPSGHGVRRGRG